MPTTIQVSDEVIAILKQLRSQENADSYNTILRKVLSQNQHQKSLAGFLGKRLTSEQLFQGLRDEEE